MLCGCGRALVEGPANDQRLWTDGDDGLRDHERSLVRLVGCAHWPADLEHAGVRVGRQFAACTGGGSGGAVHIWGGACAGVSGSCGGGGGGGWWGAGWGW